MLSVYLIFWSGVSIAKKVYPVKHKVYVEKYAKEYDLDKNLVYAVIKAESNFAHDAVSGKEAQGLMQIMGTTGEWISEKIGISDFTQDELKDPKTNIEMGTFYISYLLKMYNGNEKNALCAYNAGHAKVDSWLKNKKYSHDGETLNVIPYPETEKYVNLVLMNKKIYDFLYKER